MTKKRKCRLSELELKRRQLLDKLLEVEKSPQQKKKGVLREIYFEMFGGLPQDMIPEDRIPSNENEEVDNQAKLSDKKQTEPKKKSTGFFGAVRNMFKGSSKAETKPDKKAGTQNKAASLSKSMIATAPVYENDQRDERWKELTSPTEFNTRRLSKGEGNGQNGAENLEYSSNTSTSLGVGFEHRRNLSASYISTTTGTSKEQ